MKPVSQILAMINLLLVTIALCLAVCIGLIFTYNPAAGARTDKNNPQEKTSPPAQITDLVALAGEKLFAGNCQQCHAVTSEVVVGPGLAGLLGRRDEVWLTAWIKNSQKVIQSGDKYAVALYNKYGQTQMPSYENFSDDEIKAIIKYIEVKGSGAGQSATQLASR